MTLIKYWDNLLNNIFLYIIDGDNFIKTDFFRDDDFVGVAGVHSYNSRLKDKKPEDKPGKN